MTIRNTFSPDRDVLVHIHDLADPNVELNLNPDRWNLEPKEASVVVGRDVITPDALRIDGGRQPLGLDVPGDDAVTSAHGLDFFGRAAMRFQDIYHTDNYTAENNHTLRRDTVFSPLIGATDYAWAPEMLYATLIVQPDSRDGHVNFQAFRSRITQITTDVNTNDTITFSPPLPAAGAWESNVAKFEIIYSKAADKRGIWVTNGQKFWLLQGGTYTQYLDVGSGAVGKEWDLCRIHPQIIMFVNSKYPPHIVRLTDLEDTAASTDGALAGLMPPRKPTTIERQPMIDQDGIYSSWWMSRTGSEGSISAGTCRMLIRAVNLDEDAASEFVQVPASDLSDSLAVSANDGVAIQYHTDDLDETGGIPPPFSERWTHLEIWRSLSADGASYHREKRVNIAAFFNEANVSGQLRNTLIGEQIDVCTLADADLAALPALTLADVAAGGLPPICQRVASLHGITVCMGKAADTIDREASTLYSRSFYQETYSINTDGHVTKTDAFVNYATSWTHWSDSFVITDGGAGGATLGTYTINQRVSANEIRLTSYSGTATSDDLHGYIQRPYEHEYPEIKSDEDVWYSRADKFAPESFPPRVLKLSSSGDRFKNMVVVGNYVAVVMRSGVHLLYHDYVNARLDKDTVAVSGQGTPWAKSVVALANSVLWGTPDGPRQMVVSNEANEDGFRGNIRPLGGSQIRQWFRDAYDNGYDIDAGVDETNHCIRWRATDSGDANYFQVCQFSYATNRWTLLDDDSGVAYAATTYAEATALDAPRLYSVDASGNVFIVNHQGATHEYDSDTVQDTIDGGYSITPASIGQADTFNGKMVGEIIRFRSDTPTVDGQYRRIVTAGTGLITWIGDVTGLANGDEFIIGATQFRYRPAPLAGKGPLNVKTLEGVMLLARPGDRHTSGNWTDPPASAITVKTYENYADTEVSQASAVTETVSVFDEDDVSYKTEDRACAVAAQGNAIEVELECVEARMDFRIEEFEATVREEGTAVADESSTA